MFRMAVVTIWNWLVAFNLKDMFLVFFICVFIYLLVWNDGLQNGKCFLLGYSLLILAITTKQVRQCHLPRQSQATRIAKAQADAWSH